MAEADEAVKERVRPTGSKAFPEVEDLLAEEPLGSPIPIGDIGRKGLEVLDSLLSTNKRATDVIGVEKDGDQWLVVVESIERKAVPDTQDILGEYEIRMNDRGEVLGYRRLCLRHRCDLRPGENLR